MKDEKVDIILLLLLLKVDVIIFIFYYHDDYVESSIKRNISVEESAKASSEL